MAREERAWWKDSAAPPGCVCVGGGGHSVRVSESLGTCIRELRSLGLSEGSLHLLHQVPEIHWCSVKDKSTPLC